MKLAGELPGGCQRAAFCGWTRYQMGKETHAGSPRGQQGGVIVRRGLAATGARLCRELPHRVGSPGGPEEPMWGLQGQLYNVAFPGAGPQAE